MQPTHEVWDALAKFFLTLAPALVLGRFFAYVLQDKNLSIGLVVYFLGLIHLLLGLYITGIAAIVRKEK